MLKEVVKLEFHEYEEDKFHSDEAIECGVCGCKSNLFEMRYFRCAPIGKRIVCPGDKEKPELHYRLDSLLDNRVDFREEGHPYIYVLFLDREIKKIRKKFRGIKPLIYGGDKN